MQGHAEGGGGAMLRGGVQGSMLLIKNVGCYRGDMHIHSSQVVHEYIGGGGGGGWRANRVRGPQA